MDKSVVIIMELGASQGVRGKLDFIFLESQLSVFGVSKGYEEDCGTNSKPIKRRMIHPTDGSCLWKKGVPREFPDHGVCRNFVERLSRGDISDTPTSCHCLVWI
jgi:hypothetical protein